MNPTGHATYSHKQGGVDFEDHDKKAVENTENIGSESNPMKKEIDAQKSFEVLNRIEVILLYETLKENPFFIKAKKVGEICTITGLSQEALLQKLVPFVTRYAHPNISSYDVGAVGLGESGNIYLGVNLEFKGFPFNETLHAEQFLIANARNHGEAKILEIALSAAPCGHCRQFLYEMGDDDLLILTPNKPPRKLVELLPDAFGPKDLGVKANLLTPCDPFTSDHASPLNARAIEAAHASYAPYTQSLSGVAILTKNEEVYTGSLLENAAYNPSISPFHAALVALLKGGHDFEEIAVVVLAEQKEAKSSHASITEVLLKHVAPEAIFHLETLEI